MKQFYWHIHHDVLAEPLLDPIGKRIAFIKRHKPKSEHELRLRLLKPVQGALPKTVVKARAACLKAGAAYDKARAAYDKAWAAYDKARAAYLPEIEALHAKECPNCPWDGKTIFTEGHNDS